MSLVLSIVLGAVLGQDPTGSQDLSAFADAEPLESKIVEVTVFGGSASVKRRATLPAGESSNGKFVLAGLPLTLDPDSVRVRLTGGEVVGVEVRERYQPQVANERVQGLRDRLRQLEREVSVLDDEDDVLSTMQKHIQRLLVQEESAQQQEVKQGRVDKAAWEENFAYLRGKLDELTKERRELNWKEEEKQVALNDLRLELGRFEGAGGVRLRDVMVDAVSTGGGGQRTLDVEYVVSNAGWQPSYDLRAKKDLSGVDLVYRAKVSQRSGEDWRDATILLSTARPQVGAQGPEPRPVWLSLYDPRATRKTARTRAPTASLGYAGDDARAETEAPAPTFAEVQSEGLSVRFRLPRTETIESRDQPTDVLIGRSELAIAPEHYCVPAVDTTVWLRAKANNTSDWVMLPGRASVYFGADFLGHAWMKAVQLEQEFTLHLGPDPGLIVERTQLEDMREGSGIFSSKASLKESWRIDVQNAGAFSQRADGSVSVLIHETLPRSQDDRINVDIAEVKPKLLQTARWKKERQEKGTLTWLVRVPRGGSQRIQLTTEIAFPEDMKVQRR